MEFLRFLPKGLNPFKIQAIFKRNFAPEIYHSKSREIVNLGQKRKFIVFEIMY
jgi:hypothetical protein